MCSVYDMRQRRYQVTRYKGEDCVVDKYALMAATITTGECQRASITIRVKVSYMIKVSVFYNS